MRKLGLVLLLAGFFGAAFVSVRRGDSAELQWETVEWSWYAPSFLVGVVGVILLRVSDRGLRTHPHKLEANLKIMEDALHNLVGLLAQMNAHRDTIAVHDVHTRIDEELASRLTGFVEARESLIPLYGLQAYAELMTEFAGAERNINRAWSASADGYIDEVWICLTEAQRQMDGARALLAEYGRRR